jgi:PAS domain S-box-containing protein
MKKRLRALMIEDNADDADLIVDQLREAGFEVTFKRVETAGAMRKALREERWDLVLADYALPNFNAAAALWMVKQVGYDMPFIIVSGTITDETAVTAMKAGAHDFVTKDHLARLGPAVERELAEAALRVDRARLTSELHAQQDRFRAIVEKSPDALAIVARDGSISYVSPPIERATGDRPDEWIDHPIFEFVHPESLAAFNDDFAAVRERTGSSIRGMHRFRHKDGGWRWFALAMTNLLHEACVQGIVVNLRDVGGQLYTQEELRQKAALLEAQLDSSADGVLIVDDDGHTLLRNRRMAELLKWPPDLAEGPDDPQRADFVLQNLQRPQEFSARLAYLYAHPDEAAEDDIELKDGTVLHRYSAPVAGRDGKHYGRMWVYHKGLGHS